MKKTIAIVQRGLTVAALVFFGVITRDGERVVPPDEGIVSLEAGEFEAVPRPAYKDGNQEIWP